MGAGRPGKTEALVFDMDGLLFDSERVVQRTWNMAGEELGAGQVGEQIVHTLGMNLKSRTEFFRRVYGPDFPMDIFSEKTRKYYRQIEEAEGVPLKPGVREILRYGKQNGYKMAVATSSRREHSTYMLKKGGIYTFFDEFMFGDMVENAKPDPEIYLLACQALGTDPEHTIAVEDSRNGILSASRAGMQVIMVPDMIPPTPELESLLFRRCGDLLEVRELLSQILSQ